ncbi:MAG TPA: GIY-YIG nuclease family protein, partial [Bacteroidales bacterium]|nr:GIY-YIG nuclease family protein [Bacteroidales bacterium]
CYLQFIGLLHICFRYYYTGSTVDLELRLFQHQTGEGANHTKKRLPVKLVYYEEYQRIDEAFYREKQVQVWSRKKKEALIENRQEDLPLLSKNYTQYPNGMVVSTSSDMVVSTSSNTGVAVYEALPVPETLPAPEPVEGTANEI